MILSALPYLSMKMNVRCSSISRSCQICCTCCICNDSPHVSWIKGTTGLLPVNNIENCIGYNLTYFNSSSETPNSDICKLKHVLCFICELLIFAARKTWKIKETINTTKYGYLTCLVQSMCIISQTMCTSDHIIFLFPASKCQKDACLFIRQLKLV